MSSVDPISSSHNVLPGLPELQNTSSGADLGKEEFLELLIAQLQYQDPLEPLSNQEYSAQLAQFSQLEQLQNMNDGLEENLEINLILTQSINNTLSATIIGKEVKAYGNTVSIEKGGETDIAFNLPEMADKLTISISDENGDIVRTIEAPGLAGGEQAIVWDGKNEDGELVESGNYSFEISALREDNSEISVRSYIYGLVTAVQYDNGAAIFRVNGQDVPFARVLEIGISDYETSSNAPLTYGDDDPDEG